MTKIHVFYQNLLLDVHALVKLLWCIFHGSNV